MLSNLSNTFWVATRSMIDGNVQVIRMCLETYLLYIKSSLRSTGRDEVGEMIIR